MTHEPSPVSNPVLVVDRLRKTYTQSTDTTVALNDISLHVERGDIVGLLGPNGAGKSTLINILCTLLQPTAGSATIAGYDVIADAADDCRSIGVVFQEPALDEQLTGIDNLRFHARLYGLDRRTRDERIIEILDLVGLADVRDQLVEQYSGGMKRRLEIGRGKLHEPVVLFLDEPTLGLDAQTRQTTREYIQQLNEEADVTVLLTTHDMEEADTLCDRVAIIDHGEIVALDTPNALKDQFGGNVMTLTVADGEEATHLAETLVAYPWVTDVSNTGRSVQVTVTQGQTRIPALVTRASEANVSITSVDLQTPSLESVFLTHTGQTIIDPKTEGKADCDHDYSLPAVPRIISSFLVSSPLLSCH
jgi:ABC-2 type transport system ATP-binding protein